jgi:hypothetical protein
MSDITELFKRVAPPADAEPAAETIDGDVRRGRVALTRDHRRRTIRRSMTATTTVAAAAVVIVVATQLGGSSPSHHNQTIATKTPATHPRAHHSTAVKARPHRSTPIKLVAYTGKQLQGFTVDKVPTGWFLSTSTQYALLIDPQGDTDNNPNAFVGKLAVLTQSKDVHSLPSGTPVTVNGQPGVVTDQGKYGLSLTYNDPSGFGVVIQAPPQLNWTDAQLVSFAEGVHVTSHALQSSG